MKACALLALGMLCISCSGKSSAERLREVEFTAQENQNNIAEVSHRVAALEQRIDGLSGEVRQINTRTYEVRNKAGRKTGMTAHPVMPTTPAPAASAATPQAVNGVPVAPAPAAYGAAVTPVGMAPVENATVQQKPKAPLPSMNDVPPPMALPGQAQPVRGNPSPSLSLPPAQAAAQSQMAGQAQGQRMPAPVPQAAPASVAVAPLPAAATTHQATPAPQRRQTAQPAARVQTATPAPQAAPQPAAQDSLALPPETVGGPAPAVQRAPQGSAVQTMPAQGVATAKLPAAAKGEDAAYKAALSLVMSGRSDEGRQRFNEFLQTYPSGRYAANAHYWIGESYYAQGNYPEALMAFKQVSTQFPRHHKTADALLKAGMTYQKLGDRENAQLQYKALQSDFPNSEAAAKIRRSGR